MLFLGCDAGSTKTELMLAEDSGRVLAHEVFPACNFISAGPQAFQRHMGDALNSLYRRAERTPDATEFSVFGLTGYGEMEGMEQQVPQALGPFAPPGKFRIVNDAVVGLAGSLGGGAGINVVAGTGSIVYGDDGRGNTARAGGWSLLFDDLGSGCWIGRQVLQLFFRQADGRDPQTPLYHVVRRHFGLGESDLHLVGKLRGIEADKARIARFQLLAEEAALQGDPVAKGLYAQAARDLAHQVDAVRRALWEKGAKNLPVSYSGGVFKSGDLILEPFRLDLEEMGLHLAAPLYSPCLGAVAMAARQRMEQAGVTTLLAAAAGGLHKK